MAKRTAKAIYLLHDVETYDYRQKYVGGGCFETEAYNKRTETVKCLYSRKIDSLNLESAQLYVDNEMNDRTNARVVVLPLA